MHKEVLYNNTEKVWNSCSPLRDYFYLAGGTALALQIGHRKSIDLDFFSDEPIKKTLLKEIEELFNTTASVIVNTKNELTVSIHGVKLSFIHYPFPLLYDKIDTFIVPLANIKDIASMKAYALGRRQSLKDYVDLYSIFSRAYVVLGEVVSDANKKYGEAFNDRLFYEQLVFIEDLEDEAIDWVRDIITKEKAQEYFKNLIKVN